MSAGNTAQHDQHEQHASDVEADHQLTQLHQRAYAVSADGEGHRTQRTEWRQLHDHVDDVEHHMGETVDEVQYRLAVGTQAMQGETEDHREHQHLQDIAIGEGANNGRRDYIEDKAYDALVCACRHVTGNFAGIQGRHVNMHASARLNHVNHDQADQQRDSRHDFEVEQGITAGLADRFHALHAGNTADHRTENNGRDDHLDQFDKAITQRFESNTGFRVVMAQQDTDSDRYDYLHIQGFVQWLTSRHCKVPQVHHSIIIPSETGDT